MIKLGVCIDDVWRYIGVKPPPSIIIPHVFFSSLIFKKASILEKIHLPHKKADLNSIDSLAKTLSKAGVKFVRFWLQWNFIQPTLSAFNDSSKYTWVKLDQFINALKQAGIELLPVVGCGYQRMLPNELVDPTKNAVEYIKRVYESTREIVGRYKNLIKIWQIENEPNWWFAHYAAGWRKGLVWFNSKFKQMLLSSLKDAVTSEDKNAQIVINLEVDRRVKDLSFYGKYCDIIGLDYYPNYSHAKPIDVSNLIPKAKNILEEAGKRIIVCETGYPSAPSILGYSKMLQAIYIKKLQEALNDESLIEAVFIWRLSDSKWRSFPEHENHFGLIEVDGTPKPSWYAYLSWIKKFK
ncbi:glycosyl hydrolase 53 family protein [Candidatus Bathyarchaeota archaeon]|nr:glycosyl hydrolase 53 family protein [Candidatus Bathyarchaeota archaeon]